MRVDIVLLAECDLLVKDLGTTGSGNETEERGRGVQWSGAEFGVGLETDKVRVVCFILSVDSPCSLHFRW